MTDTPEQKILAAPVHQCKPAFNMVWVLFSINACMVNKKQRVDMERIIAKYEGSFGYCSAVKSTYGSFARF